jgi:hypothetical protein
MTHRILFVTGTRADFGKLEPLAAAARDAGMAVSFFVTGMHLMDRYGRTKLEVGRFPGAEVFEFQNQREGDPQDMILAKTVIGFSDFLTEHRPDLAVVHGAPSAYDPRIRGLRGVTFEGAGILKIATQLARHKHDRQRQAVVWDSGRHAVTRTRVVEELGPSAALIECWLETGRTHQIRVHMSYAGHGLLGDQTYGGSRKFSPKIYAAGADLANSFPRQALHAASLGFDHPKTGKRMEFTSDLPADLAALIEALRAGAAGERPTA